MSAAPPDSSRKYPIEYGISGSQRLAHIDNAKDLAITCPSESTHRCTKAGGGRVIIWPSESTHRCSLPSGTVIICPSVSTHRHTLPGAIL